jgi:D-glycero-alpha-D-manno-heptose 1-phosphate guanylyltransferase
MAVREAIILAGGLGTRLRMAVPDTPKVLAPVAGRPFLAHLLALLEQSGFSRAVLAVGYRRDDIIAAFGQKFGQITLDYSVEEVPLGTGGAVWRAADHIKTGQDFFVFNGDTYAVIDAKAMEKVLMEKKADLVMAVHAIKDAERYGLVDIDDEGFAKGFHEKIAGRAGMINAGVYLMRRDLPRRLPFREAFSLETDFLQPNYERLRIATVPSNGYFVDIGVPEDYEKANIDLAKIKP